MDPLTIGLIGGSVVSGLLGYGAEKEAAEANKRSMMYKATQLEQSADLARFSAELNNTKLQESYNDTAAQQMVIAAVQGRTTSGSVSAIRENDKENLDWDKRYITASGEYQASGYERDAAEMRIAAITGASIDKAAAGVGLLNSAVNIGKLK